MWEFVFRSELGYVVSLIIVSRSQLARGLGFIPSEITHCCFGKVFTFLFQWKLEEVSGNGVLVLYILISEAVALHVEETYWILDLVKGYA